MGKKSKKNTTATVEKVETTEIRLPNGRGRVAVEVLGQFMPTVEGNSKGASKNARLERVVDLNKRNEELDFYSNCNDGEGKMVDISTIVVRNPEEFEKGDDFCNPTTRKEDDVHVRAWSLLTEGMANPVEIGDDMQVTKGKARVLGARRIGWTKIRVKVKNYATPLERLLAAFVDNDFIRMDRVDQCETFRLLIAEGYTAQKIMDKHAAKVKTQHPDSWWRGFEPWLRFPKSLRAWFLTDESRNKVELTRETTRLLGQMDEEGMLAALETRKDSDSWGFLKAGAKKRTPQKFKSADLKAQISALEAPEGNKAARMATALADGKTEEVATIIRAEAAEKAESNTRLDMAVVTALEVAGELSPDQHKALKKATRQNLDSLMKIAEERGLKW